jgi:CDP-diacylglycerol--glycerol-3-phosphate 3-phosphatidyltransferase
MKINQLPNTLTIVRMSSIPILAIFYLFDKSFIIRLITAFLFIILSLTDALDGYFARKYKLESNFGKCFDPIADKLLIISMTVLMVYRHEIWIITALIFITREIIITGIREYLGQKSIVLDVSNLGKYKMITQSIGMIIILLVYNTNSKVDKIIILTGNIVLAISAIISLISATKYITSMSSQLNLEIDGKQK